MENAGTQDEKYVSEKEFLRLLAQRSEPLTQSEIDAVLEKARCRRHGRVYYEGQWEVNVSDRSRSVGGQGQ